MALSRRQQALLRQAQFSEETAEQWRDAPDLLSYIKNLSGYERRGRGNIRHQKTGSLVEDEHGNLVSTFADWEGGTKFRGAKRRQSRQERVLEEYRRARNRYADSEHFKPEAEPPMHRAAFSKREVNEISEDERRFITDAEGKYNRSIPMEDDNGNLIPLKSRVIEEILYSDETALMKVTFVTDGSVVIYSRVPPNVFYDLVHTYKSGRSLGGRFWDLVRKFERRGLPFPKQPGVYEPGKYYPKESNFVREGGKISFTYDHKGESQGERPESYMTEGVGGRMKTSDRRLKQASEAEEAKTILERGDWELDEDGNVRMTGKQRTPGAGRKPKVNPRTGKRRTHKEIADIQRTVRERERASKASQRASQQRQRAHRKENQARAEAKRSPSPSRQMAQLDSLLRHFGGAQHNIGVRPRGEE